VVQLCNKAMSNDEISSDTSTLKKEFDNNNHRY